MVLRAADPPGAAGLRLAAFGRLPRAAQSRQHPIEGGDADAGEAVEAGAAAQPRGGERVRRGGGSFAAKETDESHRTVVWESPASAGLPMAGADFRNRSNSHPFQGLAGPGRDGAETSKSHGFRRW